MLIKITRKSVERNSFEDFSLKLYFNIKIDEKIKIRKLVHTLRENDKF